MALLGVRLLSCPRDSGDVCNFMSHEKCLKHVKTPCSSVAPSLVRVPVAHCFGLRGLYKRKFCAVCRKGLEAPALRCEVCELHVHPDCVPFACSDCRQCHRDGHRDHDTHHHHWREGNLPSGARCEVCRKTCGSSDVLAGVRCEWCGVQAHSVCSTALAPECTFGRLHTMVLPPACVRLLSRNFSKMHCFRISETFTPNDLPDVTKPVEQGLFIRQHRPLDCKAGLVSVSHVYSSQGAVVLDVTCFAEAERLYMLVRDTAVHGRPLTALVLPDVLHTNLPPDCCPLLVFVNPKSGGLKGRDLLCSFRKLLNPHQVFELTNGGPLPGFHVFSQVPCFRVLVCGGDGTVGWVLAALEETRRHLACPEPSVAILPLGTGNDLGRVLRWGAGYSGEDPFSVLVSVDEADAVLMDRWTILLDAQEAGGAENSMADVEPPKIVQMSNYCGIGIDAELSLDFHHAREEEPGKFTSRLHNKGVYVRVGLQKISHSRGLHREIRLQVEQREVELPSIEGLIFINIPSWGSGADLWGSDSDSRFEKPRMDDGLLEVVGVTGVMHMGQVQGGLRSGIRIAQGSYFRVTLLKATPVQVDGEPWIQAPGHMIISAAGPKVHMLRKTKQKPRKAGTPKDARADGVPVPEGDPK
ncbi:diacylglycerol kinase theta [Puma concolor]|uniref:Diacylglycerol kinase n=1 Tax=Puma concolor TaxID=9696 RepID=A0A6P6HPM6_PUMCO|nr:diacylglycerol kinase theta [Puma concolor]